VSRGESEAKLPPVEETGEAEVEGGELRRLRVSAGSHTVCKFFVKGIERSA